MFQDHKIAYLRKHVKVRKAVPFTMLRTSLAYILGLGTRQIPHASGNVELDVTPLMYYGREEQRAVGEPDEATMNEILFRNEVPKYFSAFFTKAFSHALSHAPCMNSFLDYAPYRNGGTLYHAEYINMGINVHTRYGAVRPVFRNAHLKPLEQVAREQRDLARRARNTDPEELFRGAIKHYLWPSLKELDWRALYPGYIHLRSLTIDRYKPDPEYLKIPAEEKLSPHEILGATCSITNVGSKISGHPTVTALTPPEVVMLGLGDLKIVPRYVEGKLVPRAVVILSLTIDHRAYDGGEAFPFLEYIHKYIADPALIYGWKAGDDI
ncbi:MAG: 2-oxo acid dehydrogenase subunit E2 [Candidatus Hydrogenedentes bacterium]|nr:2-oxo acid dehydrogenase subunit E2 [Candidatus Hydrogenedentota bacterium]